MRFLIIIGILSSYLWAKDPEPFRFHLMAEPYTLDPRQVPGIAGTFLFTNLFQTLYKYDNEKGLIPYGAKSCQWSGRLKLHCELNQKNLWSNGEIITANDYVRAFQGLVDPKTKSVHTEHILSLKNARKILKNQLPPTKLGIRATSPQTLDFEFDEADPEFLYKTLSAALSPLRKNPFPEREKAQELITSGPYKISQWIPGKRIRLEPNHFFSNKKLPPVEIIFVEDDTTALNLFETGRLNLLRRMDPAIIPLYEKKSQFLQVPMARFDYIGLGPALAPYPHLREALVHSLHFEQLKALYHSKGLPGCPSFPEKYMTPPQCLKFHLEKARAAFKKVPLEAKNKRWKLVYSKMGGEGIRTGMEWIQNQWKIHLGLDIELISLEQGMFLQKLANDPPEIFRKGGNLHRPTCLAGLELFSQNHPENYIRLNNKKFEKTLLKLSQNSNALNSRKICSETTRNLLDTFHVIPLGQIHYSMLSDGHFKGWSINELQQLDLSELELVTK